MDMLEENKQLKQKIQGLHKSLADVSAENKHLKTLLTQNNIQQTSTGNNAKMFGQVGRDVNIGGDDNSVSVLNMPIQNVGLVLLGTVGISYIFSRVLGPYLNANSFLSLSWGQWGAVGAFLGFAGTISFVLKGKLPNFFNGQSFIPLLIGFVTGSIVFSSWLGPFLESNLNISALDIYWSIWGALVGLMVALSLIKPGSALSYNMKSAVPILFWVGVSVILFVSLIGPYWDSSPFELFELPAVPVSWSVVGAIFGLSVPILQRVKGVLPFSPKLFSVLFVAIISALYFSSTVGPFFDTFSWVSERQFTWEIIGLLAGGIAAWRLIPKF